jgi:hypothetical protein
MTIFQIPEPPTPGDFDEIFDRFDEYLDKLENICIIGLIIVIALGALWVLSKIFGGKKR